MSSDQLSVGSCQLKGRGPFVFVFNGLRRTGYFKKTKEEVFVKYLMMFFVSLCILCFGNPFAVGEGTIGFNVNQVVDARSGGISGNYASVWGDLGISLDGDLQFGEIYRGQVVAAVTYPMGPVEIKIQSDNTFKGYMLKDLGRNQTLSGAVVLPFSERVTVDVGIGGQSAAPWGAPNAYDDLLPKGYDAGEMERLNLRALVPKPRGIPFPETAALLALVRSGWDIGPFAVEAQGHFQLTGEAKLHQLNLAFRTGYQFGPLSWLIRYDAGIGLQGLDVYREGILGSSVVFNF